MIFEAQPPQSERPAGELRTLHVSLNAPVIAIDALPVGPARAAIALGLAASGGFFVRIGVRSEGSGEARCFAPADDPADEHQASVALDAALTFAESMGFLFDDEDAMAAADDPAGAAARWSELLGEWSDQDLEIGAPVGPEPGQPRAEPPVLELVDEVGPASRPTASAAAPEEFVPPSHAPDPGAPPQLSKLRIRLGGAGAPPP